MEQGRKLSGKKREEAERLGIATQMEGGDELLAWAGVYARLAQNGAMPMRGAIKGEIYDRFVTELGKKNERMQLQGMSADEAREVMSKIRKSVEAGQMDDDMGKRNRGKGGNTQNKKPHKSM